LLAELYAIYKGFLLAINMNINELVCYFDSLHCVDLIKGLQDRYHIHAVLIQNIKELLSQTIISLCHRPREGNQYVDFFAKFGAFSDVSFMTHVSPLEGVCDLLKNDAMETFFLRE
jgi:hypothetical protein